MRRPILLAAVLFVTPATRAAEPTPILNALPARNIGPANMGGRIVDVAVVERDPKTVYVAAATGGLWKTSDAGVNWTPLFDAQTTLCLGAVAVSQSDPRYRLGRQRRGQRPQQRLVGRRRLQVRRTAARRGRTWA